jgi:hypothetical protein
MLSQQMKYTQIWRAIMKMGDFEYEKGSKDRMGDIIKQILSSGPGYIIYGTDKGIKFILNGDVNN